VRPQGHAPEGIAHGPATLFCTAAPQPDAAVDGPGSYGLGSENQNLPGFITICPTRGHGGVLNYGNAFLPAVYQGTAIGSARHPHCRGEDPQSHQ
jgi:hypothetical protein